MSELWKGGREGKIDEMNKRQIDVGVRDDDGARRIVLAIVSIIKFCGMLCYGGGR